MNIKDICATTARGGFFIEKYGLFSLKKYRQDSNNLKNLAKKNSHKEFFN